MILVDTSVWIDHLCRPQARLVHLLETGEVLGHPFVRAELGLGSLRDRAGLLRELARLPQAIIARVADVDAFIERHHLFGQGIGYVDCHLLAAARLSPQTLLWTHDKRLASIAKTLGLSADRDLQ